MNDEFEPDLEPGDMIVFTAHLIPASGGPPRELGRITVCNDAKVTPTNPLRGNYIARLGRKGTLSLKEIHEKPQKVVEVQDYPRKSYSVWVLLARALKSFYP